MDLPNDVLIGLDAGTATVTAAAFAPDGCEIARSTAAKEVHYLADGGVEQEPGGAWQATAAALRDLAGAVPGLAARTAALAITGPDGGTWLVDDDGDPVAPAWLPSDRRAASLAARWRRGSIGRDLREITGRAIEPSLASAQLAWLAERRPALLDRAATAFQGKDWLYFCCTNVRATDAAGAFGNFRTGGYDGRVLELLRLGELARLFPAIVDGTQAYGELTAAAAAATGLVPGTPVVPGPSDLIAVALAAGLAADAGLGCSILCGGGIHIRAAPEPPALGPEDGGISAVMPYAWTWFKEARGPATVTDKWLVEIATQLVADAGLIGIRRDELVATLEQKAAAAAPGALVCHSGAGHGDRSPSVEPAGFLGISGATTFYDLLRSIRERDGLAARACYDALGGRPEELRVTGGGAVSPLGRQILAACIDAPLRVIRRETPAAAGAAMIAAVALGHYRTLGAASRDWAGMHLDPLEPVDRPLQAIYASRVANPLAACA